MKTKTNKQNNNTNFALKSAVKLSRWLYATLVFIKKIIEQNIGQMCLRTSTQLYYRSRESINEIARIILAISQMISTFSSDFFVFILLFQFKSEPAQTLMSEVFYSRPIKALSQRVDQTSGKQMNNLSLDSVGYVIHILFSKLCLNDSPFSRCLQHRHNARSCITPRYLRPLGLVGRIF